MAYNTIFGRFLILAVVIAAVIGAAATLGGLYLTHQLGPQKEVQRKETEDTPEVNSFEQTKKITTSEVNDETNQSNTPLTGEEVYWKQKDGKYYMYDEGNRIDEFTNSAWSGSDLVVYDQRNKKTFLFEDFEARNDNTLRLAVELGQGKAYWKQRDNKYYMYYEGNRIDQDTNNSWSDDDLVVYDQKNKKTYVLENFAKLDDNVLRAAKEIKK